MMAVRGEGGLVDEGRVTPKLLQSLPRLQPVDPAGQQEAGGEWRASPEGVKNLSGAHLMVWSKEALSSWLLSLQKLTQVTPLL